ncbi:MAG UNVERIFIED_CONTAM: hypothetical protein LVT10_14535 [Anaerolineae bacterium]|jgi:hypothetical protein
MGGQCHNRCHKPVQRWAIIPVQGMTLAGVGMVLWLAVDGFAVYRKRVIPTALALPPNEHYGLHPVRLVFLFFGGVMVVLTLLLSRGNEFSVLGILTWVMSILLVGALLLPDEVLFGKGSVQRWRVSLQQTYSMGFVGDDVGWGILSPVSIGCNTTSDDERPCRKTLQCPACTQWTLANLLPQ